MTDKTFFQSKKMIGALIGASLIFILVLLLMFAPHAADASSAANSAILAISGLFMTAIGGQSLREAVQAKAPAEP